MTDEQPEAQKPEDTPADRGAPAEKSPLVELLDRARAGDDAARDELFQKCRNYVAFLARAQMESWLQAKVDASDLIQQTMMEAHRALDQFRGQTEAEWLAWLRRILHNNAADFVRHYHGTLKRRAGREVPMRLASESGSRDFLYEPSDPGQSPSALVMQYENEILLADAIAKLSPDHQEVILLRNLQRLQFNDIAERMGRSRPAVQMLWKRAIEKLQEILASPHVE